MQVRVSMLEQLKRDQAGATAVEYGLVLSLIFLAIASAVSAVADTNTEMWNGVSSQVSESVDKNVRN